MIKSSFSPDDCEELVTPEALDSEDRDVLETKEILDSEDSDELETKEEEDVDGVRELLEELDSFELLLFKLLKKNGIRTLRQIV